MASESAPIPPETLFAHAKLVRAIARQLVRDESVADDVVQETWIAALQSPPEERGALRAFLAKVSRRFALRSLRSDERRERREARAARPEELPSTADAAARHQVLRDVTEAVLGLDEPYRATILARYYERRSPHAIARSCGVPVATVYSRLRRGLERLREELVRRGADSPLWSVAFLGFANVKRGGPRAVEVGLSSSTTATASSTASRLVSGFWNCSRTR